MCSMLTKFYKKCFKLPYLLLPTYLCITPYNELVANISNRTFFVNSFSTAIPFFSIALIATILCHWITRTSRGIIIYCQIIAIIIIHRSLAPLTQSFTIPIAITLAFIIIQLLSKIIRIHYVPLFSTVSAFLLIFETGRFVFITSPIIFHESIANKVVLELNEPDRSKINTLPNIYHIVFDMLPSSVFLKELSKQKYLFQGATIFANNSTYYNDTLSSLSSMFTGMMIGKTNNSMIMYQLRIKDTFLSNLRKIGYHVSSTSKAIHLIDADDSINSNDFTFEKEIFAKKKYINIKLALKLWHYSEFPYLYNITTNIKLMPHDLVPYQTIQDVLLFDHLLDQESLLPANGRYLFYYFSMPHPYYAMNADCSYNPLLNPTNYKAQTACSLKTINKFFNKLKKLKRLDQSIVIIHSDHGIYGANRKHPFMLIKPKHNQKMRILNNSTNLLDIAPTVLSLLGLPAKQQFRGKNIANLLQENSN